MGEINAGRQKTKAPKMPENESGGVPVIARHFGIEGAEEVGR